MPVSKLLQVRHSVCKNVATSLLPTPSNQSIGQAPLFLKNKQFTQRLLISFVFLLSLDRCLNNVNNASTLDVR